MEELDFEPDYEVDDEGWGVEQVTHDVLIDPTTLQVYELEEGEISPGYLVSLSTLIAQQIREAHQRFKCFVSMRPHALR